MGPVGAVVVVIKLLVIGISASTSFILALRVVLVAKLFLIFALYSAFLTTSFFTTLPISVKSSGAVSNFPVSNLFIFTF